MRSDPDVLLRGAIDATLNRLRVLAREMCPEDGRKLEMAVTNAFRELSEIAAVERGHVPRDVH